MPAVREAVVVAREDEPGDKRLVAYVTREREAARPRSSCGRICRGQLPEYMVPAAFVRLEALPLTPNGKLDRKALPAPEARRTACAGYEAPRGEIEETLARIWAEVLQRGAGRPRTTTSSSSAATRCWRCGCWSGCVREDCRRKCRCERCSMRRCSSELGAMR